MSSLFALPAGRLAKWLFALGWLVIVVVVIGANLPGKFADAEKNESTSFLPGSAESTKALHVTERLQDGEKAATVIVYRRDGGLTAEDRRAITNDVAQLNRITARFANSTPFGNPAQPRGTDFHGLQGLVGRSDEQGGKCEGQGQANPASGQEL